MSSRLHADDNDVMTEATFCPQCGLKYSATKSETEAKLLSCLDTFCSECLQKHVHDVTTNYPWSQVRCQLCQTPIEESYAADLKMVRSNPIVEILLRIESITTNPETGSRYACDACDADSSEAVAPRAEFYCEECDQKMCAACHSAHGKLRATKSHAKVCALGSQESKTMARSWRDALPRCVHHKSNVPGEFYCGVCKAFVCGGCAQEHVKKHNSQCHPSKLLFQDLQEKVSGQAEEIAKIGREFSARQETIDEQRAHFASNVAETRDEILRRTKKLREILDAHTQELLDQLDKIRRDTEEAFAEATDSAKRDELRMARFVKFAKLANSVDLATLNSLYPALSQRADNLRKTQSDDRVRLIHVGFSPGLWQQAVDNGGQNCLGSISVDIKRSPPNTQSL